MINVDTIIAFEQGDLGHNEEVALLQKLIDSGEAWTLQGFYRRAAQRCIDSGECEE